MSLFTSLYAFNRVALVDGNQLYVTKNIVSHLDKDRQDPQANWPYLLVLVFMTASIARAYPEAIPPKRRARYSRLFTHDVREPSAPSSWSNHLILMALGRMSINIFS